jgi:hypothetical protein
MITLIHGSDIIASRKYFLTLQASVKDPVILSNDQLTMTDLAQTLSGNSLFQETKHIFIEHFFRKKQKAQIQIFLSYLFENTSNHSIYLWENREIEKSTLILCKNAQIKEFRLPQSLFVFLESLKPGNGKQLLFLFRKTLETVEVEVLLFMLIRQFRLLLFSSDPSPDFIEEFKKLADWQKSKIAGQSRLFGKENLVNVYDKLFAIEYGQKTGTLSLPLTESIDFFLSEL